MPLFTKPRLPARTGLPLAVRFPRARPLGCVPSATPRRRRLKPLAVDRLAQRRRCLADGAAFAAARIDDAAGGVDQEPGAGRAQAGGERAVALSALGSD